MAAVVDHVFICTARGAPPAERLRRFGLIEGPPNRHPGQGTANRRFFFRNFMLDLLWVEDALEIQSEQTRPTRLFERFAAAGSGGSPFGIVVRPGPDAAPGCPFEFWEYRPATMPGLALQIASGTGLEEPMWCYTKGYARAAGIGELTGVRLVCPPLPEGSVTRAMARAGVIDMQTGAGHLLELQFDGRDGVEEDFRPDLPLRIGRYLNSER